MRVTTAMTAESALYNLQKGRAKLDRLQEEVTTGYSVNRPSDDPISARQIMDLQHRLDMGTQYQSNISKGTLWLSTTDTALQGISDFIDQAKSIASGVTGGTSDQNARNNAISQLTELKKQVIDLANTKLGDQYIFAGTKTDTPPFDRNDTTNTYNGTVDDIGLEIYQNSQASINITGDKLLQGTGTYGSINILDTFDGLIAAITANNVTNMQTEAGKLDNFSDQLTNARADVAVRTARLKSTSTMITQDRNSISGMMSDTRDVDYLQVATELNQQQTAFQAALSATAKISQMSLMDYLA